MLWSYGIIRSSARRVAEAASRAVRDLRESQVEQEPEFTSDMLSRIRESMDNYRIKGVRWRAKILTALGSGSQEHEYGADFMGVLSLSLSDFQVNKGFLAQAKLVRGRRSFPSRVISNLKDQCEKMLRLSPDSLVFLYSKWEIRVVPAISVLGSQKSPIQLYSWDISTFFEKHFESFIGDPEISSPTIEKLVLLQRRYNARAGLYLQAEPLERGREGQHG